MTAHRGADGAAPPTPAAEEPVPMPVPVPAVDGASSDRPPSPAPGGAPVTGDERIDADLSLLTAASHGPLSRVLERAERLHDTLQGRLAQRADG